MDENACNASAVKCWDSIHKNYGCATYVSMVMMGNRLVPSAFEVDVVGVVSMYTLLLASGTLPSFQDWNNNYGDNRDMRINTHCNSFPRNFMQNEVEISNLDVLGAMTFFRASTDGPRGIVKAYLGEGQITDDSAGNFQGGTAVCRVPDLQGLLDYLCKHASYYARSPTSLFLTP